jgi:ABC-type glycerol-3-phosphate transport system substrate-binding protein
MFKNKSILIGCGAGLIIFIIVLVVFLITGGRKKEEVKEGPSFSKPLTLTLWTPIDEIDDYEPYVEELQDFNVKLEVVKKNPATYEEELINSMAAGEGPDVWLLKNDWLPKHKNKLVPAEYEEYDFSDSVKEFKKSFISAVGEEMVDGKKIYGAPMAVDPLVLYINDDIYSDAMKAAYAKDPENPIVRNLMQKKPETWDDFKEAVKIITQKQGNNIVQAGAALGTSSVSASQDILYLMMGQNGTKFNSVDKKEAVFHTSTNTLAGVPYYPGTSALELYTSFANPSADVYTWSPTINDSLRSFIDGKVGMMIAYASSEDYIKQISPTLSYSIYPLPQIRETLNPVGFVKYWSLVVNRNTKDKDNAWELVYYLTGKIDKYLSAKKLYSPYTDDLSGSRQFSIDNQILKAKTVYKADSDRYDKLVREMIDNVVINKQSFQVSIETAATKITRLLNGELIN